MYSGLPKNDALRVQVKFLQKCVTVWAKSFIKIFVICWFGAFKLLYFIYKYTENNGRP